MNEKMRHRIVKSNVNYWPNRNDQFRPVATRHVTYQDFPAKVHGIKQRVRGEKFQEHYNQAQLYYNSIPPCEKAHLVDGIPLNVSLR